MKHDPMELHQSCSDGCLARFKAECIDGLDTTGEPAKVGTALHRAAEAVTVFHAEAPAGDHRAVAAQAIMDAATALDMAPGSVVDALGILEQVLAPDSRIALHPRMGMSGAAEVRWGLVEDGDDFVCIENPGPDEGPFVAAGTIDLLEWQGGGGIRVTDWKTHRAMLSATDAWESWQGRLYVFAVLRMPRFAKARMAEFGYVMLRHGYTVLADFQRGDPWEAGVRARLVAVRDSRRRALDTDEWPETPGPWCQWCPVMMHCEALGEMAEQGAEIDPTGSAASLARRALALKHMAGKLDRHVRGLVKAPQDGGEPIHLGDPHGTVLGFKEVDGMECLLTYDRTMDRLRELGMTRDMEIEHFRFVSQRHFPGRVRKVLRELRAPPEIVEDLVIPVCRTRFTTFVPERQEAWRPATPEEVNRALDRYLASA